jgi:hypothetical protein
MGFALKRQGVHKDDRARRVREAARLLDLGDELLDRKRSSCPAASGSGWQWAGPSCESLRSS